MNWPDQKAGVAMLAVIALSVACTEWSDGTVLFAPDDIGGHIEEPGGPEAGVWVIAETDDLQTKFRKIVVTEDNGR